MYLYKTYWNTSIFYSPCDATSITKPLNFLLLTHFLVSWGPPLEGRVDRSIYAGQSALGVSKQTCSVSITKVSATKQKCERVLMRERAICESDGLTERQEGELAGTVILCSSRMYSLLKWGRDTRCRSYDAPRAMTHDYQRCCFRML